MRELVESRVVRGIVLLLALGVGGVAGAPAMSLPPRAGVTVSGGPQDDEDGPGGDGGGGDGRGPIGPSPVPTRSAQHGGSASGRPGTAPSPAGELISID